MEWYIRNAWLVNHLLYPCQHAYQNGKSTDTALFDLVSKIERSWIIELKQQTLSVSLDIDGACDNICISYNSVISTDKRIGINNTRTRQIGEMLTYRKVTPVIWSDILQVLAKNRYSYKKEFSLLYRRVWWAMNCSLNSTLNTQGYRRKCHLIVLLLRSLVLSSNNKDHRCCITKCIMSR